MDTTAAEICRASLIREVSITNPQNLLLRTPETEPFMDVEPFVHGRLDREISRPLLILLGVRETPTGPDRLLDCLRALVQGGESHPSTKSKSGTDGSIR